MRVFLRRTVVSHGNLQFNNQSKSQHQNPETMTSAKGVETLSLQLTTVLRKSTLTLAIRLNAQMKLQQ